ncbi:uncharacterized protein LOC113311387 [Papaver somniferum]|uniref:uncharacterized protein LOC113311387 n=1 Tax=Papaver somniferum TaxID=3469 RepID=UPI000E702586|nr:uncharacterized protein LOC113311387 [Papaver somniferum]
MGMQCLKGRRVQGKEFVIWRRSLRRCKLKKMRGFKELETRVLKLQEENATLRDLQVDAADETQLIRTETSPNPPFTPASCKCSSLQINSNGVLSSGDAPPDYFARAVLGGFETEGTLTGFRKCSGTPSTENQVVLKQASTTYMDFSHLPFYSREITLEDILRQPQRIREVMRFTRMRRNMISAERELHTETEGIWEQMAEAQAAAPDGADAGDGAPADGGVANASGGAAAAGAPSL